MSSEIAFKNPLEVFSNCKSTKEVNTLLFKKKKISIRNKQDNINRINSTCKFTQMKRTWGKNKQKEILKAQIKNFGVNNVDPTFRLPWPSYGTLMDMLELQNEKCAISGKKFVFEQGNPAFPSIDRIDSSKGYGDLSNIWIVCTIVNYAKNDYSLKEFLDFFNLKTSITEKVLSDLSKGIKPTHNDLIRTGTIKGL
jgi:hypothetical protein